jgi:hypothetical protein
MNRGWGAASRTLPTVHFGYEVYAGRPGSVHFGYEVYARRPGSVHFGYEVHGGAAAARA